MTMSGQQVSALLATAAAYDQRTVGHADMAAWTDAAERGRWDYTQAADAIKTHYARHSPHDRRISPGDITGAVHGTPSPPSSRPEPFEPASAEARATAMAEIRRTLANRSR